MRIQKSYLSKVMARNASISKDQGYLLGKYLGLDSEELDYLFLLIDFEKCALKELRDEFEHKIKTIQISKTQSDQYLEKQSNRLTTADNQKYYLLPENQLIHLALSIEKYQKDIDLLRKDFNLNQAAFSTSLKTLEQLNLIQIKDSKVKLIKSNLHLDHDSPFFHQWKAQMMMKGIEWVKGLETKDKYNFTVSFTSDEETKENIRIEFLNFLKKIEKLVTKAPSKNLYQLNFDLFKWL